MTHCERLPFHMVQTYLLLLFKGFYPEHLVWRLDEQPDLISCMEGNRFINRQKHSHFPGSNLLLTAAW